MSTIQLNSIAVKRCRLCHRLLPVTAFGRNICRTDGLQQECLACRRQQARNQHGGMPHLFARFTTDELQAEIDRRQALN